jgi:ABC-type multidrug transport system ATPase subunit
LIGASGCGKTTLLSCIIGMNSLDYGKIVVLGEKVKPNKTLKSCLRIGFMPQGFALQDEFTVNESLYFFGNLFQMKSDILETRVKMLIKLLKLPPFDQKVIDCSGGQQRRISLAVAMIHNPDVLILDEPTVGLDPILRDSVWNFMINLTRTSKISIILTTHYIEEATKADQCGLMRNGILLDEDTPKIIMNNYQVSSLEEAFLCLCVANGTSEDFIDEKNHIQESSEIEMNETCIINDEYQENLKENCRERKFFNVKTLKALIFKSYVQVVRRPM